MKKYAIIELPDNFEKGQCDECPVSYMSFECESTGSRHCSLGGYFEECPIEVKELVPVADIVDDVFEQLRDATEQEQESVGKFVERIGVNIFDEV
jgi:dissimilatory sulfite reductase (desulfoviridin) alpha/beta subunit